MTRTQVHLPDSLYRRVKRFAEAREISLAEVVRRGVEMLLDRHPESPASRSAWSLPVVDGGGLKIPLDRLRDVAAEEECRRGTPRR